MVISFFSQSLSCSLASLISLSVYSIRLNVYVFFLRVVALQLPFHSFFFLFFGFILCFLSFSFTLVRFFGGPSHVYNIHVFFYFSIFLYRSLCLYIFFLKCLMCFCSSLLFRIIVVVDAAVLFLGYKIFGCIHPIHMESSHLKCIKSIECLVRMVLLSPTHQQTALSARKLRQRRQPIQVLTVILLAIHHANWYEVNTQSSIGIIIIITTIISNHRIIIIIIVVQKRHKKCHETITIINRLV